MLFLCSLLTIYKKFCALNLIKSPLACKNKEEIRNQIDVIDAEIIRLFALRQDYVHEIVKFKKDIKSIIALKRKNKVIEIRGKWAEDLGLDKVVFEEIFRLLIEHNIQEEMQILNNQKKTKKSCI